MTQTTSARQRRSPSDALGQVLLALSGSKLTDYSTQRLAELMTRFVSYVEKGHGIRSLTDIAEEHVEGFVCASTLGVRRRRPSVATMHLRRSALRLFFRTARDLRLHNGDPTMDLRLPPRSSLPVRALTDEEIVLGRSSSLHSMTATNRSAAWALAEATARTSEIPQIRISDLDLEKKRVWLHGSNKAEPRWGHPTLWGLEQLARRRDVLEKMTDRDSRLVYRGEGNPHSAQASSCLAIADSLQRAGLSNEPDVRPGSVVAWAGIKVFESSGCIGEVARALGMRTLDGAARMIDWQWSKTGSEPDKNL